MKIYSYLHSGKAVLATDLPTHTQVLNPGVARLVQPDPQAFAAAMIALAGDVTARAKLGAAARALAEQEYTPAAFARQFDAFFDWLQQHCGGMRKGA
jgi:glycosyltransferase involved in cell wall biosynthesis